MKSRIRLSLVLSLAFHMVLLLGFFSGVERQEKEADGLVVELVSLGGAVLAPTLVSDSTDSSDLPPEPAFPVGPDENFDSMEGETPPPDLEEPETTLPAESAPFDPDFPSREGMEEPLPKEQSETGSVFRLVSEVDPSKNGSAGVVPGEGAADGSPGGSAPQPTVGDALFGGIGGAGGGRSGPRFVIPKAGRSNPKPRYPERARAEGREGTALLKVTVLPTGEVGEAMIEHSSGHADLDRSAVEAVMRWTFLPARRGENPVISSVRIPVTFSIDRR